MNLSRGSDAPLALPLQPPLGTTVYKKHLSRTMAKISMLTLQLCKNYTWLWLFMLWIDDVPALPGRKFHKMFELREEEKMYRLSSVQIHTVELVVDVQTD